MRGKKVTTDQYAEEKRWVFTFDIKEESEGECQTDGGREFENHRSILFKGSLPQGPPRNMEYPRLSEESEKESRDEATQRGMVKPYRKQCGSR